MPALSLRFALYRSFGISQSLHFLRQALLFRGSVITLNGFSYQKQSVSS